MSSIHLVLGGIRSGKSAYAERLASDMAGGEPVLYLATGVAVDPEMEERIQRHQRRRPPNWQTLEAPLNPVGALQDQSQTMEPPAILLLDSMDVWVSNLMLQHEGTPRVELEARIVGAARRFADYVREMDHAAVIVSSEVGHSLIATTSMGRQFQDLLGTVNQAMAAAADRVTLVVAGLPVPIKPFAAAAG
ncbi:MAG: bifunctional adenosylcobinamide kinase/adenosylcobinamide-phosphate guanylyltransferase [Chloroflexota bacterium]|nr:bifunctional adenosylcobinamide kinase/adenosylcobinamide-phosphate guanylyltransferase [Chloroflexota bacterium]MDE2962064.1 bifunctional adenosylcobinamide kinase/adenosylcobinamide-phosphate guanylyltransferase [Chloroflexota bacterium]